MQEHKKLHNIWIVKPGEASNRGNGIQVAGTYDRIIELIQSNCCMQGRTCIVQKYIHNPLLIKKRKFDIRTYSLLATINGNMKGYAYEEGYLRTSSSEFTLDQFDNL